MNKERFLAFTDAIIAIIATIMVLELRVPETVSLEALKTLAIPLFAYAISFAQVLNVWYNHHNLFKRAEHLNARIYAYNVFMVIHHESFSFCYQLGGKRTHGGFTRSYLFTGNYLMGRLLSFDG
ncbi:MAG: TMEM175 family protein [Streptococcaceae bacterium]|nr:TMEM175 family protein [Streptococcaceae bacterium]